MNALGAERARAHDLRDRRVAGTMATNGVSPEVDPSVWPHARYCSLGLEPDVDRAAPVAQAARGARAGARLVVVDPFRSRTARVADEHVRPLPGTDAALALGMMRAIVDAGLARRGVVPRARRRLRRAARAAGRDPVEHWARRAACRRTTIARSGASSPPRSRRCCGSASAPSATRARRSPTARSRACPRSRAPGATSAAAARTSRPRRAARSVERRSSAPTCAPGRCARSTCPSSATR